MPRKICNPLAVVRFFLQEEEECKGGAPGWVVSFADLMTLLFATFVVLYGLKPEGETVKILGVTSSIREAFVEIPDIIPDELRPGLVKEGKWVFKNFKATEIHNPIIKRYRRSKKAIAVINEDMQKVKSLLMNIAPTPRKGGESDQIAPITMKKTEDGFQLQMLSSALFESGKYRLKRSSLGHVNKIGQLLKDLGKPISIHGHTDDLPVSGNISNWELSALRATYVARQFIDRANIDPAQISVAGYGSLRPLAENSSVENRRLNRRVEIRVKYDQQLE